MGMDSFVDLFCGGLLRKGDLFVLSCASVRQVFLKRVCSSLFMGGAVWFMILFGLSDCKWFSTIEMYFFNVASLLCWLDWRQGLW